MSEKLTVVREGDVAVITLDDGKANACSIEMLEAINGALDRALADSKAVVLIGRPGVLSGGFDLKVIQSGDQAAIDRMINLGVRTMMRLYGHAQPLVTVASGHAVALGAFMLLASDHRIGVMGDFKVGLNETAIGLTLPAFAVELAQARLSPRYLTQAAISAQLYAPLEAIEVGFLDEVAAPDRVRERAIEQAGSMLALDGAAFAENKLAFRNAAISRVLSGLGS